jgi:histidinol dehydrogenase
MIAGVREIIILTLRRDNGSINPYVAATAKLLGIDKVFSVGGAQGIAAAAFGTATIPRWTR